MNKIRIGVLGGSGLYRMESLLNAEERRVDTPYGAPSDAIMCGQLGNIEVAFLARHGQHHHLLPSEVPYRANIHALRQLGVRYLLSFSAVGSLQEDIAPLDMVLPDQFIDMTRHRINTFFGSGAVAHVSMAEPVCPNLAHILGEAVLATDATIRLHRSATYLCMEGPQFSSLAESRWYRSLGADVIGMTNMPEAKLAREAQMAYASLGMVTDYDCWHPREAHVTAETAIANLMKNAERAQAILVKAIEALAHDLPQSTAHHALAHALVTPWEAMSEEVQQRLSPLLSNE